MFDGNACGPVEDEIDGEWQWPRSSIGVKIATLELSLRCLICSNYLTNPHSLSCGHSYCSECIRKHLDKSYNPTPTSGCCPTCREAALPSQLRVSKDLIEIVNLYQDLRNELLAVIRGNEKHSSAANHSEDEDEDEEQEGNGIDRRRSQSNGSRKREKKLPNCEIKRLPSKLFHIETKDKVKKALEKLTENCPVKIRLDGDKETLVKRYTEFVHLNNAQVSADSPLTLSEIVNELHKRERNLEFHQTMSKRSNQLVERIKSGQETKEVKAGFSELIKRARESKQRKLSSEDGIPQSPSPNLSSPLNHNSSQPRNSNHHSRSQRSQDIEATADSKSEKSDLMECGDWIVIQSDQLGRPFFFNITTQTGQFRVPDELSTLFDHDHDTSTSLSVSTSVSVKDDSEALKSAGRSVRKGTRRSTPALQRDHATDSGDSSDEEYTPSSRSTSRNSKGVKRSRSGKRIQSSASQERSLQTQQEDQLAQEEAQEGRRRDREQRDEESDGPSSFAQATQPPEKYIEIHEVEDDENEDLENGELDHIACQHCTYHNPIGAARCEICGNKLQNVSIASQETPRRSHRHDSLSSASSSSVGHRPSLQKNSPLPFAKKPPLSNLSQQKSPAPPSPGPAKSMVVKRR